METILKITNTCISCDQCRLICPEEAIITVDNTFAIDQWQCNLCAICIQVCPADSIKVDGAA